MAVLVLDRDIEDRLRADRGDNDRDEVWDGVLVMAALANVQHQDFGARFTYIFLSVLATREAGNVFDGVNVSDREEGWKDNYRIPDVAVYLPGNPAKDCGTHYLGGPDLAVEILSDQDRARDKAPFYASVGVREFLVLDRDPWALELYRPAGVGMALAARSLPGDEPIRLGVLPLTFRLVPGADRPTIAAEHDADGRRWTI